MIIAIILGVAAVVCFIFSWMQFHEKGFLFNNAYIYASEQERETLDKKPYYKQSGVVFLLVGIVFLLNAVDVILKTGWMFYAVIAVAVIAVVYAVVSTIRIEKGKQSRN